MASGIGAAVAIFYQFVTVLATLRQTPILTFVPKLLSQIHRTETIG
jgi:hypothetical protein